MKIAVLTLTPLARDARVLRAVGALADAGHAVTTIGREPLPAGSDERFRSTGATAAPWRQRLELVATQAPANLHGGLAQPLFWLPGERRRMLAMAIEASPDLVYCNDWSTLPIGAAVKTRTGAALVYDSHEYAAREHIQNWKWRLVSRAAVVALERRFIGEADLVVTVSDGIAESLQRDHGLRAAPVVVRNVPNFTKPNARPRGTRRSILFHGVIRPERGLEELIDSAVGWRFDGEIVIRGYGASAYLDSLRSRAAAQGLADRFSMRGPVGPEELIAQAASSDIGYLALPPVTEQYEYALPNKLFEYLMAGLAVIAAPRREIARVLAQTGAGVLTEIDPDAIAAALNGFTPERLVAMKTAAFVAARTLNWEAERDRLTEAVGRTQRIAS